MGLHKKYNLDGKTYTVKQIQSITKLSQSTIRWQINKRNILSMSDFSKPKKQSLKPKKQSLNCPNWRSSMMNDELDHWKLINIALPCIK